MPNKFNIALIATTTFALVRNYKTVIKCREIVNSQNETVETLAMANDILIDECTAQHDRIAYLLHKLDEHGVSMDEFDLIALNYRKS